jgi:hypothetical protein
MNVKTTPLSARTRPVALGGRELAEARCMSNAAPSRLWGAS